MTGVQTCALPISRRSREREVLTDESGLASGVSYVNRTDRRDYAVRARIVVLAASACESARLLLNSKSGRFPDGLANSSGVVGRYLTDSTGLGVSGHIPKMEHSVPHNEDGAGGAHLYMPWWLDNKKLDFPRGYHIELGGGKRMPGARSEERRVGKECSLLCRSRWSPPPWRGDRKSTRLNSSHSLLSRMPSSA